MTTYTFVFRDGTRMTGTGRGPAEAMLDAYHRCGYLPNCELLESSIPEPPPAPPPAKPSKRKADR